MTEAFHSHGRGRISSLARIYLPTAALSRQGRIAAFGLPARISESSDRSFQAPGRDGIGPVAGTCRPNRLTLSDRTAADSVPPYEVQECGDRPGLPFTCLRIRSASLFSIQQARQASTRKGTLKFGGSLFFQPLDACPRSNSSPWKAP